MSAIADKVKKIVVANLGCSEDQVTDDAKFIEHLGAATSFQPHFPHGCISWQTPP